MHTARMNVVYFMPHLSGSPLILGETKMMAITKLKIDDRGRISLPDHFLKANGIKKGTYVELYPVYNRSDSVRLQFKLKGEDDDS